MCRSQGLITEKKVSLSPQSLEDEIVALGKVGMYSTLAVSPKVALEAVPVFCLAEHWSFLPLKGGHWRLHFSISASFMTEENSERRAIGLLMSFCFFVELYEGDQFQYSFLLKMGL